MPSLENMFASLGEGENILADGVYNGIIGAAVKYLSTRKGDESLRFGVITAAGTLLYDWYSSKTTSMFLDPLRVSSVSGYTAAITYLLGGNATQSVNDALLSIASSTTSSMVYAVKYGDESTSPYKTSELPPAAWNDAVSD